MENMRDMLSSYDPSEPQYLGSRFHLPDIGLTYMAGGPGYILSRETVRRIGFGLLQPNDFSSSPCNDTFYGHDDDVYLGDLFYYLFHYL